MFSLVGTLVWHELNMRVKGAHYIRHSWRLRWYFCESGTSSCSLDMESPAKRTLRNCPGVFEFQQLRGILSLFFCGFVRFNESSRPRGNWVKRSLSLEPPRLVFHYSTYVLTLSLHSNRISTDLPDLIGGSDVARDQQHLHIQTTLNTRQPNTITY